MSDHPGISGVHQIALTVSDLENSREFYEDKLGLRKIAAFDPPGLMFFATGDVRLSVQRVEKVEAVSSVIYFRVDDIQASVAALKANSVEFEREAELVFPDNEGTFGEAGEEEWMAFLRDPDGHLIALASREKSQA